MDGHLTVNLFMRTGELAEIWTKF